MANKEAAQIYVSEFPENVRLRKEMYIYSKEHQIQEFIDNAVDEGNAGYATAIAIVIKDDCITIEDNGRGMPVQPHPKFENKSQAEVAYTSLHAGGKFGKSNGYKTATGGLHGVGASASNALSEWLSLKIKTGGKKYEINFEKGIVVNPLHVIEEGLDENDTGTEVSFKFDDSKEVWNNETLNVKKLQKKVKELSYLNPKITFYFASELEDCKVLEEYSSPNGLTDYMNAVLKSKTVISDIINETQNIDEDLIDIAFAYTDSYSSNIITFCNNIGTEDGGDHLIGFRTAFKNIITAYAIENNLIKENQKIETDDALEGVNAIISVKTPNAPKFEGQSKSKIKMPEIRKKVREVVEKTLTDYLDKHPNEAKIIISKVTQAIKAREAAKKARDSVRIQKEINNIINPGKLADCSSKKPEECEIYLVEGDSAGGSAKQARDRKTQAILPVFGKILNVEKHRYEKILSSEKIKMIAGALKCGLADKVDITKIPYHHIIIMTDADVDGYHIQILYVTLFYRYMREIIEKGYLYIAKPPLYKLSKGKKIMYAFSDQERDMFKEEFNGEPEIQRYKGLGEMDADQLWETTMSPESRTLIQVTIEDAEAAEEMINIAMGKNAAVRYDFIKENADAIKVEV